MHKTIFRAIIPLYNLKELIIHYGSESLLELEELIENNKSIEKLKLTKYKSQAFHFM